MGSSDPQLHYDWHSEAYGEGWISRDETQDEERVPLLRRVVGLIRQPPEAPIRLLHVGAGYGVLSQQVLELLPALPGRLPRFLRADDDAWTRERLASAWTRA